MKTCVLIVCIMMMFTGIGALTFPHPTYALSLFTDQASFRAALGNYVTEDFEDEPLVGTRDSGGVPMLEFDDFTATSQPDALKILNVPYYGNHNTTPGGSHYFSADTEGYGSADVTMEFDLSIMAFGLNLIDLDVGGEGGIVTINEVGYDIPQNGNGGVTFFGILEDTAFSTVHLDMGRVDSHWSMDDIDYQFAASAQVPEPTTMFLVGIGLIGLIGIHRKRKK